MRQHGAAKESYSEHIGLSSRDGSDHRSSGKRNHPLAAAVAYEQPCPPELGQSETLPWGECLSVEFIPLLNPVLGDLQASSGVGWARQSG